MEHKIYQKLKQNIREVKKKIGPECTKKVKKSLESLDKNLLSLYRLVIVDAKTKLYNSRFFEAVFSIEIEKAKRGQKLSLIIIDMDNLKRINEGWGHKKGDEAIRRVSYVIKNNIRKADIASRFGGDEFVILLPFTSCSKALEVGTRLQKSIRKDRLLSKYNVTVSMGVSEFEKNDTANKMFNKADFALLCVKKKSKNMIMSYKDV